MCSLTAAEDTFFFKKLCQICECTDNGIPMVKLPLIKMFGHLVVVAFTHFFLLLPLL